MGGRDMSQAHLQEAGLGMNQLGLEEPASWYRISGIQHTVEDVEENKVYPKWNKPNWKLCVLYESNITEKQN